MQLGNMPTEVGRELIGDVNGDTFNTYIREGGENQEGRNGKGAKNNQRARVAKRADVGTFEDLFDLLQWSVLLKAKEADDEERKAWKSAFWKDIRKLKKWGTLKCKVWCLG